MLSNPSGSDSVAKTSTVIDSLNFDESLRVYLYSN
jgi:hypothetical protein